MFEIVQRDLVRELDACGAGSGTACVQMIERGDDRLFIGARRRRQHHSCRAGVDDDRDRVFRAQTIDEHAER